MLILRGAVAQDGRIEPGDMILEVNGVSFENTSNDDAVTLLREAVQKPGLLLQFSMVEISNFIVTSLKDVDDIRKPFEFFYITLHTTTAQSHWSWPNVGIPHHMATPNPSCLTTPSAPSTHQPGSCTRKPSSGTPMERCMPHPTSLACLLWILAGM